MQNIKFYGSDKFVYRLVTPGKQTIEKMVFLTRRDEEVIKTWEVVSKMRKSCLYVTLNGEEIHRYRLNRFKRILDVENGRIFTNVYELSDELEISYFKARKLVDEKFKYKWLES